MSYKHLSWYLLIAYGGVVDKNWERDIGLTRNIIDFYGNCIDAQPKWTQQMYHDIINHGINWDITDEPKDSCGDGFNGTFDPEPNKIYFLFGLLKLNNGSEYLVATAMQPSWGISGVLRLLACSNGLDLSTALETLSKRLNRPEQLRFTSTLPSS